MAERFEDELRKVEIDATAATQDALPDIQKAVGVAALKGKKAWQEAARRRGYAGQYPDTIDYDPVDSNFSTDVGPNPSRLARGKKGGAKAGLAIVEDSPGGVAGAPQRNYVAAIEVVTVDLERGVTKAIEDAMRKRGL